MGKEKKTKRKIRIAPLIIIPFFLLVAYGFINQWQVLQEVKAEHAQYEEEYNEAIELSKELEEEKNNLTDPFYIEKFARENLRMILPGEYLVVEAVQGDVPTFENNKNNQNEFH